ncbi:MAG TPA: dethiobiotin synthase [Methylomirabilota bacterium]|nr:dethiobiotin synthase [Methylomirabilota bacterium]
MTKPAAVVHIVGSDTGVGKTVLTALLLHHLRSNGGNVRAVKPVATGDQSDAQILSALQGAPPVTELNRWFWPQPVAPLLAARNAGEKLSSREVVDWLNTERQKCDLLLVEGAGGVLSPLGERFSSLEIIKALPGKVLAAVPDRVGAINQARLLHLVLHSHELPHAIILMGHPQSTQEITTSNTALIQEFTGSQVYPLPYLGPEVSTAQEIQRSGAKHLAAVCAIARSLKGA